MTPPSDQPHDQAHGQAHDQIHDLTVDDLDATGGSLDDAPGGAPDEAADDIEADADADADADAEAGVEDGGEVEAVATPRAAEPSRRWGRLSALVSLAYVAWYVVGLVVLRRDAGAYNAMNRFYASLGARVVLCGVLLALLFHLLDGLRVTVQDAVPGLLRRDVALRTAVRFLLLAAWIPASVAVLWPAIRTWFSR